MVDKNKERDLLLARDKELDWLGGHQKSINKAKDKETLWVSQPFYDEYVVQHLYDYDNEWLRPVYNLFHQPFSLLL